MAKKRKQPERRITRTYDAETGIATLTYADGKRIDLVVQGLPLPVLMQLAMVGAAELVSRRREPESAWAEIQAGKHGEPRRKRYPLTVQAIAQVAGLSLPDAQAKYSALPIAERRTLAREPAITQAALVIRHSTIVVEQDIPQRIMALLEPKEEQPASA